jgi:hypothetical protein
VCEFTRSVLVPKRGHEQFEGHPGRPEPQTG